MVLARLTVARATMGFPVGLQVDASKRPRTGVPDSDASEARSSAQNNHQRGIPYVSRPLLSGRNVVVEPIVEAIDHSFDRGTLSSNGVAARRDFPLCHSTTVVPPVGSSGAARSSTAEPRCLLLEVRTEDERFFDAALLFPPGLLPALS